MTDTQLSEQCVTQLIYSVLLFSLLLSITTGEDDLPDIIRELTDVVANWRDIGTLLGIRDGQLRAIQLQANSPLGCLREMLVTWLQKNYNVERFGEPIWVKLVEAVNNQAGGGNPSLAKEIARKHGGTYIQDGIANK